MDEKRVRGEDSSLVPDDPRFFDSLVRYIAPSYDYIFTASEKAIPMYRETGCENVYFLPFACEPTIHRKLSQEGQEKYESDVVFVGSYTPRRARLIKALEKAKVRVEVYGPYWKYFERGPHIHDGIYGPEMVRAYNATKIVLNIHVESDLPYKVNMRMFEAAGCRTLLLTDKPYGLEKQFSIGSEIAVYNSEGELIDAVKYYLDNDEERGKIGSGAQSRAYREHTYEERVKKLLSVVGGL